MAKFDLRRKVQTAGIGTVGIFMEEFIHAYEKWHGERGSKAEYIRWFHDEYGKNMRWDFDSTKTKCYAMMEIIEQHRVLDALDLVLNSNDKKVEEEAFENAGSLLDKIIDDQIVLT